MVFHDDDDDDDDDDDIMILCMELLKDFENVLSVLWGCIFGVHSAFKKQMDRIMLLVKFQRLHAWFLGIF